MSGDRPRVVLVGGAGLPDAARRVLTERATAEAGVWSGDLDPLERGALDLPAARVEDAPDLVAVSAEHLTVATVYGDVTADPRPGPAVLRDGSGAPVAVRLTAAQAGVVDLSAATTPAAVMRALAEAADRAGARELGPGAFPVEPLDPADPAPAIARTAAVDEAALRLRRASRSDDGFLSTFLIRPLSRRLTRHAVRAGLPPAPVTAVSLALGLGSATAYGMGSLPWLLAGSALLLLSLVVDCVDGEVARYTRTFSPLGGWLDVASDRVKEYAVYAGLVAGVARVGGTPPWGVALAALAVLVVRHFVDFGFAASAAGGRARGDVGQPQGGVAALSEATDRSAALVWAKRAVIMPVGERTILLIVLAPLLGARWALVVLLALGAVAGLYTTAGRVGRAWRAAAQVHGESPAARRLAGQCDTRPLPANALGVTGRWGWLAPAACRAVEQGVVVGALALAGGTTLLPAAYAVLFAAAFRDYDIAYRQRLAGALATDDRLVTVGWPVRTLLVVAVAAAVAGGALSAGAGTWLLVALVAGFGVAALTASARWWAARGPHHRPVTSRSRSAGLR